MNTPDADAGLWLAGSPARSPRAADSRPDAERIDHILLTLRRALAQLEGIVPVNAELLERNSTAGLVVERVLANLVEMAFGINSHSTRVMSGRKPDSFRESCLCAVEFGMIDPDLAAALVPADGLPHIAMQLCLDAEPEQVESVVDRTLSAYQEYERQVIEWATSRRNRPAAS